MAEFDRNKKLAEIKSSIELLEECKQKVNDNPKLDETAKKDRTEQIDEAIKENYDKARLQFRQQRKKWIRSLIMRLQRNIRQNMRSTLRPRALLMNKSIKKNRLWLWL